MKVEINAIWITSSFVIDARIVLVDYSSIAYENIYLMSVYLAHMLFNF